MQFLNENYCVNCNIKMKQKKKIDRYLRRMYVLWYRNFTSIMRADKISKYKRIHRPSSLLSPVLPLCMPSPEYQHLQNINNCTNDTVFAFPLTVLITATREVQLCLLKLHSPANKCVVINAAVRSHWLPRIREWKYISRDVCRACGDDIFVRHTTR